MDSGCVGLLYIMFYFDLDIDNMSCNFVSDTKFLLNHEDIIASSHTFHIVAFLWGTPPFNIWFP